MDTKEGQPAEPAEAERETRLPVEVCPFCGGDLQLVHCELRCQRCHALIEGCCEGDRYPASKTAD